MIMYFNRLLRHSLSRGVGIVLLVVAVVGCDVWGDGSSSQSWDDDCDESCCDYPTCEDPADCILEECSFEPQCNICGDGILNYYEWMRSGTQGYCDGEELGAATCASVLPGSTGGTLQCTAECTYDTSACYRCGNGVLEPGESCEGASVVDSCDAVWAYGGDVVTCGADCQPDYTSCVTTLPVTMDAAALFMNDAAGNIYIVGNEYTSSPELGECGNAHCPLISLYSYDPDLTLRWRVQLNRANEYTLLDRYRFGDDGSIFLYGTAFGYESTVVTDEAFFMHISSDGTMVARVQDEEGDRIEFAGVGGAPGTYFMVPELHGLQMPRYMRVTAAGEVLSTTYLDANHTILHISSDGERDTVTTSRLNISTYEYEYGRSLFDMEGNRIQDESLGHLAQGVEEVLSSPHGSGIFYYIPISDSDTLCYLSIPAGEQWCVPNRPSQFVISGGEYLISMQGTVFTTRRSNGTVIKTRDYASLFTEYRPVSLIALSGQRLLVMGRGVTVPGVRLFMLLWPTQLP